MPDYTFWQMSVRLIFPLKLAVTCGLLWLVMKDLAWDAVLDKLGQVSIGFVAIGLMVIVVQIILGSVRWFLVVARVAHEVPYPKIVRLFLIGLFFNQMLPSTVGGDGARAWFLHRAGTGLADAIKAVLIDRALGTLALVVLAMLIFPVLGRFFPDPATRFALLAVCLLGISGIVLVICLSGPVSRLFPKIALLAHLHSFAVHLREALTRPREAALLAILSFTIHGLTVFNLWFYGLSIGLELHLLDLAVLVPPMMLIAAVPISIGGWGLREGLVVTLLGVLGVEPESALLLSIMFGLGLLAASLPGAAIWLFGAKSRQHEIAEMREKLAR